MNPPPPLTALSDLDTQLRSAGYAVLDAASLTRMSVVALQQLNDWLRFWDALPPDAHLRDGGRYRRRRHGSFVVDGPDVTIVPPRAHWQPLDYNALHGGIERWFEPLPEALTGDAAWNSLLAALGRCASALRGEQRWFVEAHSFRIETGDEGIGRPTPEGAHRDGVDLVAVILVARRNVKGGETRVFDARGPQGLRFTLDRALERAAARRRARDPRDHADPAAGPGAAGAARHAGADLPRPGLPGRGLSYAEAMSLAIDFNDVQQAAQRLAGVAHRTPVLHSRSADERSGATVFFKCENLQRMGAFKFRGAYNALSQFTPEQKRAGAIAFSSGNHAQAVALSARLLGMPSVIVMPQDAPQSKLDATRAYQQGMAGSEVVLFDRYTEDREALCRRLADERGMTMIPPFDHPQVMAGQGTAALELIEEVGTLDALLVCVGGGGLISGCAVAARHLLPGVAVYGVEPEAGNDTQLSLQRGEIVRIDTPRTIADGAQTQASGQLTFPVIQALVKGVLTVSDAQLVETMRFFATRMKLVVEPTGCLAAAAVLQGAIDLRGQRVGVIVSGGNVDLARFAALLAA